MMHDRGIIKWKSLMIPEHKEMLQGLYAEQKRIQKPELDEQEEERVNQLLRTAMHYGQTVELSIYSNYSLKNIKGQVQAYDSYGKHFKLLMENKEVYHISAAMIVDANIL